MGHKVYIYREFHYLQKGQKKKMRSFYIIKKF